MSGITLPDDKPAKPVRQYQADERIEKASITERYTAREQTIIHLHKECALELHDLRAQRDRLEEKIRQLVPVEYRLARMVGIIERAYEDDDSQADGD